MRPLHSGGSFAAHHVPSVQGVQAVPAEAKDDNLAEDLAGVAAGDLADVEEDDLAGGGSVRGDGLKLLNQGLGFLDGGLEGDPDLVVKLEGVVDDDDLAKVTSQGGLESGLGLGEGPTRRLELVDYGVESRPSTQNRARSLDLDLDLTETRTRQIIVC